MKFRYQTQMQCPQQQFRIFNWEANNCWKNNDNGKLEKYYDLAEIVLKRVDPQTDCAK